MDHNTDTEEFRDPAKRPPLRSDKAAILEVDRRFQLLSASQACRRILPDLNPHDPSSAREVLQPLLLQLQNNLEAKEQQRIPIRFPANSAFVQELASRAQVEDLLDEQGRPCGHRITLSTPPVAAPLEPTDLTDRRVSPEEWRQARLASMGALCGGVAHKMNNLLVGILGYAEILGRQQLSTPDQEAVSQILQSGLRARDLCADLLQLNGERHAQLKGLELWQLLEDSSHLFKFSLPQNCKLEVRSTGSPCHVRADPSLLKRIILQLLLNAGRAVPDTGAEIRLSQTQTSNENSTHGDRLLLDFWNNGPPIAEQHHRSIFRPGLSLWSGGSGLGLHLARQDARSMGAELSCIPCDTGALFRLDLPLSNSRDADPAATTLEQNWSGSGDVLIVDDEHSILNVLEKLLNARGFQTWTAADGEQGLELFLSRQGKWDLVLVDMRMPGLDGRELCRRLRELAPTLPILLSSGVGPDGPALAQECGASDYLQKPFTALQLVQKIHKWCLGEFSNKTIV